MAITVAHQPSAATIAQSAYAGGLGEFEKFRLQRQLAVAEMAQRERLAIMDMANRRSAQMASQAHQAQQAGFDRLARTQMQGMEMAGRKAELDARREDREAEMDLRWDLGVLGEEGAWDRAAMIGDRADKAAVAADTRAREDDRRAFIMDRYSKGDWTLSGGQRARLEKIRSDRAALLSDPRIPEHIKQRQAEMLDNQYWSILESPTPPLPGETPKSIPEQFGEETMEKHWPDGSISIYSRDRSGAWREVGKHDPHGGKGDMQRQVMETRKEMAKVFAGQKVSKQSALGDTTEEPLYTPEELDQYIATGKLARKSQERQQPAPTQLPTGAGPHHLMPDPVHPDLQPTEPQLQSGMGPIGQGSLGRGIVPPPPPQSPSQDEWAKKLPKTPEEARKKGIPYFIAPDGTIRKLM